MLAGLLFNLLKIAIYKDNWVRAKRNIL